ncbi:hypothetical protein ABK040_007976 [Willaertia magna]
MQKIFSLAKVEYKINQKKDYYRNLVVQNIEKILKHIEKLDISIFEKKKEPVNSKNKKSTKTDSSNIKKTEKKQDQDFNNLLGSKNLLVNDKFVELELNNQLTLFICDNDTFRFVASSLFRHDVDKLKCKVKIESSMVDELEIGDEMEWEFRNIVKYSDYSGMVNAEELREIKKKKQVYSNNSEVDLKYELNSLTKVYEEGKKEWKMKESDYIKEIKELKLRMEKLERKNCDLKQLNQNSSPVQLKNFFKFIKSLSDSLHKGYQYT